MRRCFPILAIGFIAQGCTQNTLLLRNGNPRPESSTAEYRFPDFKKSEHIPPDSVIAFVAGKLKYKSRFYRDSNGNVLKTLRYDPDGKLSKEYGVRKIALDTLPTMEIRKSTDSNGAVKEVIASSIKMPGNVLIMEKYGGDGKLEERAYGVLDRNNLLVGLRMEKGKGLDSVVYEYSGNIVTWDYQYRNGKVVAKVNHLMRDEKRLLKSIAYSCRKDGCKESGVLEQYYVENQEGR